jgi:hypothetical protein
MKHKYLLALIPLLLSSCSKSSEIFLHDSTEAIKKLEAVTATTYTWEIEEGSHVSDANYFLTPSPSYPVPGPSMKDYRFAFITNEACLGTLQDTDASIRDEFLQCSILTRMPIRITQENYYDPDYQRTTPACDIDHIVGDSFYGKVAMDYDMTYHALYAFLDAENTDPQFKTQKGENGKEQLVFYVENCSKQIQFYGMWSGNKDEGDYEILTNPRVTARFDMQFVYNEQGLLVEEKIVSKAPMSQAYSETVYLRATYSYQ